MSSSDAANLGTAGSRASTAPAAVRYRSTMARGILVFRWVALVWMTTLAATSADLDHSILAWSSIGAAALWTAYLTAIGHGGRTPALVIDLTLCAWLLVASGIVVPEGAVVGNRPFFATAYPVSAALAWGVARGPRWGVGTGAVLAAAFTLSRPLNGVALAELNANDIQNLIGSIVLFLVAGGAVGLVTELLVDSGRALERATTELVAERERAARLAEREALGRQIHDSVLQSLALVHKRGRELADRGPVDRDEVARLAEIAGRQEHELRSLILRQAPDHPSGEMSLRSELEQEAMRISAFPVSIGVVGPIVLDAARAREVAAAVRQALENAVEHSGATKASVFAEEDGRSVTVSVRDNGRGFVYDEARFRADGHVGLAKSMKGRIEELGGEMTVTTSPGAGTEIEFRFPVGGSMSE